jgi:putative ATP-dependent endonuclease of OLD family
MRVVRLTIDRFRGIKNATLDFTGHTLLVGGNNVGKSTVCEALDLVLGPDRLSRFPPIEEYDFYNAEYLNQTGLEFLGDLRWCPSSVPAFPAASAQVPRVPAFPH